MKQIKTIARPLGAADGFDKVVNEAIADGWTLTRRAVLQSRDLWGKNSPEPALYAELEREEITEAERCCENCAHFEKGPEQEPCLSCSDDADKWEPAT